MDWQLLLVLCAVELHKVEWKKELFENGILSWSRVVEAVNKVMTASVCRDELSEILGTIKALAFPPSAHS